MQYKHISRRRFNENTTDQLDLFSFAGSTKKKWTPAEIDELKIVFKDNLRCLTTPGMKVCQHAMVLSEQICEHEFRDTLHGIGIKLDTFIS